MSVSKSGVTHAGVPAGRTRCDAWCSAVIYSHFCPLLSGWDFTALCCDICRSTAPSLNLRLKGYEGPPLTPRPPRRRPSLNETDADGDGATGAKTLIMCGFTPSPLPMKRGPSGTWPDSPLRNDSISPSAGKDGTNPRRFGFNLGLLALRRIGQPRAHRSHMPESFSRTPDRRRQNAPRHHALDCTSRTFEQPAQCLFGDEIVRSVAI